nr:class I SAM-dependent rRNA methyltransferase [Oceanococcus sp. HetDA_MAG_MS8]
MKNQIPVLRLKPREQHKLRRGSLWVYSNQIDTKVTPIRERAPGELIDLEDAQGQWLARGYMNPATLIAVRILCREPVTIDADFFAQRLRQALAAREAVYTAPFYRLVHGEGDYLPGLVVDRFGDVLVVQENTAGMAALRDVWLPVLQELTKASAVLFRNANPARQLEGLPEADEWVGAAVAHVEVEESGVTHRCDLGAGQKTGWFYDQRPHRELFAGMASGRRVLDVFSYLGGWGLGAAAHGAQSVDCIDASAVATQALLQAARNAELSVQAHAEEASKALRRMRDAGRQFDLIVVDPPALIKRRKDFAKGREHYARLNHLALQVLAPGGVLFAASCSHHMPADELLAVVQREASKQGRQFSVFHRGGAGPDHPVHPALPETAYLKVFGLREII